jgi:hypothetical protein
MSLILLTIGLISSIARDNTESEAIKPDIIHHGGDLMKMGNGYTRRIYGK